MSNFFCGLLTRFSNFADAAEKSIQEVENVIFQGNVPAFDNVKTFTNRNEPGTCRLIRTATKHLVKVVVVTKKFRSFVSEFLRQNELRSVPLRAFRG